MDTASSRVYAQVKHGILDRSLAGGQLLTEGEIADLVGVSRTPVREGLLQLQAEGLVHLIPKRGALVVPVSPAEVADKVKALEREVRELRQATEILRKASAHFAQAELDRPFRR